MLNINLIRRQTSTKSSSDRKKFSNNSFIFLRKDERLSILIEEDNRVPNLGTDSREKGIHFIGSRELNIKPVARDRSCSVVINRTCFNKLIEYANWCCLSVDVIQ